MRRRLRTWLWAWLARKPRERVVPLRPYHAERLPVDRAERAWAGRREEDFTRAVMELVEWHWYEAYVAAQHNPVPAVLALEELMRDLRERLKAG